MADVVAPNPHPVTPAGWEYNDNAGGAVALVDLLPGDLVKITSTGWTKLSTNDPAPDGICVHKSPTGFAANIAVMCEIEGYTGLTLRALVYPSPNNAGKVTLVNPNDVDTTALAYVKPIGKCVSTTKIRFHVL